jgi:hypothetical protein
MTLPLGVIAGATFFLALCPNLGAATGTESPRDLVGVCTSARAENIAYCEGCIEGAAHIWKFEGVPDVFELRDPPQDPRRRGFGEGSFQASAIVFVTGGSPCAP